jgi:hypothetical protein
MVAFSLTDFQPRRLALQEILAVEADDVLSKIAESIPICYPRGLSRLIDDHDHGMILFSRA